MIRSTMENVDRTSPSENGRLDRERIVRRLVAIGDQLNAIDANKQNTAEATARIVALHREREHLLKELRSAIDYSLLREE